MIVAFTGHRPDKLGGYDPDNVIMQYVADSLYDALHRFEPETAISGMALGVDTLATELCLAMDIPVIAAVPFLGQEKMWPAKSQRRYHQLLSECQEVVYVSDPPFTPQKMQDRNKWMVDRCNLLIAVFDGTKGGTANCVNYAESVGRKIYRIDPRNWR